MKKWLLDTYKPDYFDPFTGICSIFLEPNDIPFKPPIVKKKRNRVGTHITPMSCVMDSFREECKKDKSRKEEIVPSLPVQTYSPPPASKMLPNPQNTVIIARLSYSTDEHTLRDEMEKWGRVCATKLIRKLNPKEIEEKEALKQRELEHIIDHKEEENDSEYKESDIKSKSQPPQPPSSSSGGIPPPPPQMPFVPADTVTSSLSSFSAGEPLGYAF
ncbi:hypothetical protein ADUPG1_009585, partial [Aduncisulcus paluster]